jgi:hypothetical protein
MPATLGEPASNRSGGMEMSGPSYQAIGAMPPPRSTGSIR